MDKLTFTPLSRDLKTRFAKEAFEVPFNPNSYSITKGVTWTQMGRSAHAVGRSAGNATDTNRLFDAPILTFGGGGSRQLTLELFFDVTEPITDKKYDDVRELTGKIVALTRKNREEKCPLPCEISWGAAPENSDFPFVGVISNLIQRFVFFNREGVPLRANLTAVITEYPDPEKNLRETDPELTTRIVKRGDTLSSIAAEVYRDPALWREIAEANHLDDPRRIKMGQRLTIPKLN